jgi:hypothetical protein
MDRQILQSAFACRANSDQVGNRDTRQQHRSSDLFSRVACLKRFSRVKADTLLSMSDADVHEAEALLLKSLNLANRNLHWLGKCELQLAFPAFGRETDAVRMHSSCCLQSMVVLSKYLIPPISAMRPGLSKNWAVQQRKPRKTAETRT